MSGATAEVYRMGSFRLPRELAEDLERWCVEDDRSRNGQITHILRLYQRQRRQREADGKLMHDDIDDEYPSETRRRDRPS